MHHKMAVFSYKLHYKRVYTVVQIILQRKLYDKLHYMGPFVMQIVIQAAF